MRKTKCVSAALAAVVALSAFALIGPAGAANKKASAKLSGAVEVPGPGDDDGSGKAKIRRDGTGLCFNVRWKNITAPTAAHIHRGEEGVAGDVEVALFAGQSPLPSTISKVAGCIEDVDDALLDEIFKNPEGFYVNVHNADFPAGAIRGQLN
jgi:hypothetical protein